MQHPGRVGRIADHHQIGVLGQIGRSGVVECEGRRQHHLAQRHAGRRQDRFGFGERRGDQRGEAGPQRRQQGEALGSAVEQQHMIRRHPVAEGDGLHRGLLVGGGGIAPEVGQSRRKPFHQPGGRLRVSDVDGEVQHSRRSGLVAVIARTRARNPAASLRTDHLTNSSAPRPGTGAGVGQPQW